MIYYMVIMLIPFTLGLWQPKGRAKNFEPFIWFSYFLVMTIFVGLRHKVGMDWNNYMVITQRVATLNVQDIFQTEEWLYFMIMYFSESMGYGIYGSNFVASIVFLGGLFMFCAVLPNRWIGILVSLPILVFIFGMSANRQAAAIGVLFGLLSMWGRTGVLFKIVVIYVASLFHTSAIIMVVFVFLDLNIKPWAKVLVVAFLLPVGLYFLNSLERVDYYVDAYGAGGGPASVQKASGALSHVLFNAGPAFLILLSYYRYGWGRELRHVYLWIALVAIFLIPMSFVVSNAASRISMYFFPASLIFFSVVSSRMGDSQSLAMRFGSGLIAIYVSFVMFYMSNSGFAHLNYQNYLFITG